LLSSDPGAESPPSVKIGSSIVTVVLLTVVVVPLTVRSPPTTTAPLNVALPARAISISRAVIADDPSVPLIAKFLSATLTVNSTSLELFAISKIDVPSSLNVILAPPASKMISAVASKVMLAPESIYSNNTCAVRC
jgi:anti-sigma-K factor RskA